MHDKPKSNFALIQIELCVLTMLGKRLRPRLQSIPALVDPMESAAILVNVNVNTSASHPHSSRRSHLSIQNTEATSGVDSDNEDVLNATRKSSWRNFMWCMSYCMSSESTWCRSPLHPFAVLIWCIEETLHFTFFIIPEERMLWYIWREIVPRISLQPSKWSIKRS